MNKLLVLFLIVCNLPVAYGQLIINELDCDSPGFDDQEFIELRSDTPYFPMDGYVVVFFNGSENGMDSSYFSIDLTGYTTDLNGIFLIGSNQVSPAPQHFIDPNSIQNGPDAVAIYKTDATIFNEPVEATTQDLIDALAYDTNDPDDEKLMELLGLNFQINEDRNNNKDYESIQRNADGTYSVTTPTPRQLNDGSGIAQIGINFTLAEEEYSEGDQFRINFTTEESVEEDTEFSISLSNFNFTEDDYTGVTDLEIQAGTDTVSTTIQLVNDGIDEGDEELIIQFTELPEKFIPLRDRVLVRVVDSDFTISPWGTPLEPTYTQVESTQPPEYYASLNGKSGLQLRQAITSLIANPEEVRAQTYADVINILKEADENPENSNEVWMLYTEESRPKLDFQRTSDSFGKWNREHVFPRSRGGFYDIDLDTIADGKDLFIQTSVDSVRHGNTDAHALRVVDARENSSRGNQNFGEYTGPAGNSGSFYGDVARSSFFIALRYTGLEVVEGYPASGEGALGDLEILLQWHRADPPDDFEMNRNNIVYTWQYNRNPFIDYPELVEYIWGDKQGEVWNENLSTKNPDELKIQVFPNPSKNYIVITGFSGKKLVKIFNLGGKLLLERRISSGEQVNLDFTPGVYFVQLSINDKKLTKKLIIQ